MDLGVRIPLHSGTDRIAAVRLATQGARAESVEIRPAVDRCLAESGLRIHLTRDLLQDAGGSVDPVSR